MTKETQEEQKPMFSLLEASSTVEAKTFFTVLFNNVVMTLIAPLIVSRRAKKLAESNYEISYVNAHRALTIVAWVSWTIGRNFHTGKNSAQKFIDADAAFTKKLKP